MCEKIYIRLDVDNAGDRIELALLNSDYKEAQYLHNLIQYNINLIFEELELDNSIAVLMKGCDDILFSMDISYFDEGFLKKLNEQFKEKSGLSLSIGFGFTINECMLNLRIAKVSGKNKIVGVMK
ncbi:mCpol domain-containing protein [uncultured Algoriphagus sp.]|uniref:mCpol domain-containing protein n=1 Tax=uncultured Algoriphagus sp. TaxID=417365 RepID=UPI0030ED7B94|tara:strand:+ start:32186 stop:32560 length:375 start_codon:yes stop_codon:yes gene_type:complete